MVLMLAGTQACSHGVHKYVQKRKATLHNASVMLIDDFISGATICHMCSWEARFSQGCIFRQAGRGEGGGGRGGVAGRGRVNIILVALDAALCSYTQSWMIKYLL